MKLLLLPVFFSLTLILTFTRAGYADSDGSIQSLVDIETAVTKFVLSQQVLPDKTSVQVRSLDARLRLTQCGEELQTQWSPGSRSIGRVTVQTLCNGPTPWRVHVQATVTLEGYVWALGRSVQRGDVLNKTLLTKKKVVLGRNNIALTASGNPIIDIEPWLGYAFAQPVAVGKILTDRVLKRSNLINKGEKVTIRHQSLGLELRTFGVALDSGTMDQRLQVRNSSSGKVVEVVVVARGLVEIVR